jgi:hypothetical protein
MIFMFIITIDFEDIYLKKLEPGHLPPPVRKKAKKKRFFETKHPHHDECCMAIISPTRGPQRPSYRVHC